MSAVGVAVLRYPASMGHRLICIIIASIALFPACSKRGTLASPGLDRKVIKTMLFFAGEQLDGKSLPENNCPAPPGGPITQTFETAWPVDQSILDWTQPSNRLKVVQTIAGMGFNTLSMSTWGESWLPCSVACPYIPDACCGIQSGSSCTPQIARCSVVDGAKQCRVGWYGSANAQVSPAAKDQLFDAVSQTSLQIIPFIESRFAYEWNFRTDFPTSIDPRSTGQLAPGLISQIEDLLDRYVINPANPSWRDHWALVYDKNGEKRRAVAIVQVASDSLNANDDRKFATAFDQIATQIFQDTCRKNACTKVGFFIDPIARDPDPQATYGCPNITTPVKSTYSTNFKPDPITTGPFLYAQASILGIHAYSPEGWIDNLAAPVNECFKIRWKEEYSRRWHATGIPFLQDVTPGYNGSKIFAKAPGLHEWGYDPAWQSALLDMTRKYGRKGIVYNSWNGYDEGLAAMPTIEQGNGNSNFIQSVLATY